jgi:hypothetical protein
MSKADISTTPILPRRAVLAGIASTAALPIAVGVPTASLVVAPAIDAIFELIDGHRKTHIVHMAAIELLNRAERRYGPGKGNWITEKPCHDEADAFDAFIAAPASTPQGLHAKLGYLQELARAGSETEWMIDELINPLGLIESFTASLENIGVQP